MTAGLIYTLLRAARSYFGSSPQLIWRLILIKFRGARGVKRTNQLRFVFPWVARWVPNGLLKREIADQVSPTKIHFALICVCIKRTRATAMPNSAWEKTTFLCANNKRVFRQKYYTHFECEIYLRTALCRTKERCDLINGLFTQTEWNMATLGEVLVRQKNIFFPWMDAKLWNIL